MNKQPTAAECRKGCIYAGTVGGIPCCNYILIERHPRECLPGNDCTRYKKGNRKRVIAEDGF